MYFGGHTVADPALDSEAASAAAATAALAGCATQSAMQRLEARATLPEDLSLDWTQRFRWENRRSVRGRIVASDTEVRKIATMINVLVDLPYWSEGEEQELFECLTNRCVEVIAETIPRPMVSLLRNRHEGISKDQTEYFAEKLATHVRSKLDIPYLDEQDMRRIFRAVVWVLATAMEKGHNLSDFMASLESNPDAQEVLVHVLMEGALDIFYQEDLRAKLTKKLSKMVKIPFAPPGIIDAGCNTVLVAMGGSLRTALQISFQEYRDAASQAKQLPLEPKGLEGERERAWILERYKGRPFLIQLRRVFIAQVQVDWLNNQLLSCLIPQRCKVWLISRFVDAVFLELKGTKKLEHSVETCIHPAAGHA